MSRAFSSSPFLDIFVSLQEKRADRERLQSLLEAKAQHIKEKQERKRKEEELKAKVVAQQERDQVISEVAHLPPDKYEKKINLQFSKVCRFAFLVNQTLPCKAILFISDHEGHHQVPSALQRQGDRSDPAIWKQAI
jgi:pantothenate kinase-related protein Tda10